MMSVKPAEFLEWSVPAAAVLFAVTVAVTLGGGLPDPVVTSWTSGGEATGHSPRWIELTFGVLAVMIGAAFGAVAPRAPTVRLARALVVTGHVAAVGMAGRMWRIVANNRNVEGWSDGPVSVSVSSVLLMMVAAGAVGWIVSGHRRRHGGCTTDKPDDAGR